MTDTRNDPSWLPSYQQDALYTLGYADSRIYAAGRLIVGYTEQEPLELTNVVEGERSRVVVIGVKPLPQAVSRIFADALNQLRGVVEHALFAEIERSLGRALTAVEERSVEMPAAVTAEKFELWLSDRRRRTIDALQPGAPVAERLRSLQPFNHAPAQEHPMWILAQHTNKAKHRAPHVAATLLGAVMPDYFVPDMSVAEGLDRPLNAGDILVDGPLGVVVPLAIWPKVSVQRPSDGTWHMVLDELEMVQTWVRTVALPTIVAGRIDVDSLPPGVSTERGYSDLSEALASAEARTASERIRLYLHAEMLRRDVPHMLTLFPGPPKIDVDVAGRWVASLSDEELVERMSRLQTGTSPDIMLSNLPVFGGLVEEAMVAGSLLNRTGDLSN